MNKEGRHTGLVFSLVLLTLAWPCPSAIAATVLFADDFKRPDGLVTNEYAFWHGSDTSSVKSPDWEMDSGSFFIKGKTGWTGLPDDVAPDVRSGNGTHSCIFRLNTKRADFGNVEVSFDLLNQGLTTSKETPAVDWDGVHVWLRYQSEYYLYYCSINRRDNTVIIKKKTPGGPSNGGTYHELSSSLPFIVPYKKWQSIKATAINNADGSVTLSLYNNGMLVVRATDNGTLAGPPIAGPGKVGIRGDNAELKFKNFKVTALN